MAVRIGIDTGGTFTDLVGFDDETGKFVYAKQPSTPREPARALGAVLDDLGAQPIASLVVGTTVATNALLTRAGARVIFVTTAGFEDVPFIGRLDKAELYNLDWAKPAPLVQRQDCFGVLERVEHDGTVLQPLTEDSLNQLEAFVRARVEETNHVAVAVCLLFAYLMPDHERLIRERLRHAFPTLSISVSHEVAPTWREYERGSTTIGDAFIKPALGAYVGGVRSILESRAIDAPASMLKSNGGHMRLQTAESQPAQFLISGLAGGIVAAQSYAQLAGVDNAFSLDMGGTSADIGTITEGRERSLSEFQVGFGIPIAVPCVDVATLGAGGGSIAWIDKGGLLQVGPRSAGAHPGPMCYGHGGNEPTTTDANLALGRLNPEYFLGGRIPLDPLAARDALATIGAHLGATDAEAVEVAAHAIVETANENMVNQIRLIAVERGLDPRAYVLVAFGGAGPVHASACARLLGMTRVLVPPHPGLSSAFGALAARLRVDRAWTIYSRSTDLPVDAISARLQQLTEEAVRELRDDGFVGDPTVLRSIDMRYAGQNYEREVSIPAGPFTAPSAAAMLERFARAHEAFYGFMLEGEPVEFVNVRVVAIGASQLTMFAGAPSSVTKPEPVHNRQVAFTGSGYLDTPIFRRGDLPAGFRHPGPAVIAEEDSTTIVHPDDHFVVHANGLIEVHVGT